MAVAVAVVVGLKVAPAQAHTASFCVPVTLPVTLHDAPGDHTIAGTLCTPHRQRLRGLQVLVPGSGYDHRYFDITVNHGRNSIVLAATRAGFATLAIDRLGSGQSSYPPFDEVTTFADAAAVHQIIQAARAGEIPGLRHSGPLPVLTVGFSVGAVIAVTETALYHDVDAIVVTGFAHHAGSAQDRLPGFFQPANADPMFADVPIGYLSVKREARIGFVDPKHITPAALDYDQRTAAVFSPALSPGFEHERTTGELVRQVTVPVLVLVGVNDDLLCGGDYCAKPASSSGPGLLDDEPGFYSRAKKVRVVAVRNAGHALFLQDNAPFTIRTIMKFAGHASLPR